MHTDIEDMRLLSLEVAEQFFAHSNEVFSQFERNSFNAPSMVALVYDKAFLLLQADDEIAVTTRAAFLKSLSGKYTTRMYEIAFSGSNRLPMDKMTESFVDQVWEYIEQSYTTMLTPEVAQTIEVQRAKQSSPTPSSIKRVLR